MRAERNICVGFGLVAFLLVTSAPSFKAAPTWEFLNQPRSLADPHIINGDKTDIKSAPYQIALESFRMNICGGVIISDTWALTAAHCLHPGISGSLWTKRIRAGATRQIPFLGWEGSIHEIESSCYDPKFTIQSLDFDVAVLRVKKRFEFGDRIRPIALPSISEAQFMNYKETAVISGWGTAQKGSWFGSWDLKSVAVPLVPRDECLNRFSKYNFTSTTRFKPTITPRMLCAAGDGKGGVCGGDSGGPLVHKGYVIGLASWVVECNHPSLPSVFTNLLNPEIKAFIRSHTEF